ncbi:MAG: glycosyltransferase [Candidatus Omnitrophica bacterium]|nr:glycosyltransferase [Candidatus Omnitrophota bacterium]
MSDPSVAIIIPVKGFNYKLKKCIEECLKLEYSNYEVLVFPDEGFSEFKEKIRIIPTGNAGPAIKRDMALEHSKADIFAFLDDDAYPQADWLKKAVPHFKNEKIAAVGGPSITPRESCFLEHASGLVFSSVLTSASYVYRYLPVDKVFEVDDYPSCNFIIRRKVFEELGGFDNTFWPGEDTKLCLDITKKLGKKIIYDPSILVHHHRRRLGPAHFKQVANYAMHRGYFAKKFPQTSLRLAYFIPSLFVTALVLGGALAVLNETFRIIYLSACVLYLSIIFGNVIYGLLIDRISLPLAKIMLIFPVIFGIIATHFCYGIYLIKGLLSNRLSDEK